jgi:hypothetical protein
MSRGASFSSRESTLSSYAAKCQSATRSSNPNAAVSSMQEGSGLAFKNYCLAGLLQRAFHPVHE